MYRVQIDALSAEIKTAEDELAALVKESWRAIEKLQNARAAVEAKLVCKLAYIAPVRRLPMDLLGEIYTLTVEEKPASVWVLASVCWTWRFQVLQMPRLWSKVCPHFTDPHPLFCWDVSLGNNMALLHWAEEAAGLSKSAVHFD